jgi:hypothetical protein
LGQLNVSQIIWVSMVLIDCLRLLGAAANQFGLHPSTNQQAGKSSTPAAAANDRCLNRRR